MKVVSYNCTGLGPNKMKYITALLTNYDIDVLILQETWLLPSNIHRLGCIHSDYCYVGVSAVNNSQLLAGRPYGGVGIIYKKCLDSQVSRAKGLKSKRLCAVNIQVGFIKLLLINCYMPCDSYSKTTVAEEFHQVVDELECLLSKHSECSVLLGGDLNIDFSRLNAHDRYFLQFMEWQELKNVWDLNVSKVDYTYSDFNINAFSCIDHFMISKYLMDLVLNAEAHDDPLNPSNHRPVEMELHSDGLLLINNAKRDSQPRFDSIAWYKIHKGDQCILEYQQNMDNILDAMIDMPFQYCTNISCEEESHKEQINTFCNDLIKCALEADGSFPRIKRSKCKPGWSEQVKPYKDEYLFWYDIWKANNKPRTGIISENVREAKRQYHYAVRRNKRKWSSTKSQKFAEQISKNKSRDFFREIKKTNPKATVPSLISDVADMFGEKYKTLYNSVPSQEQKLSAIRQSVTNNIFSYNFNHAQVSVKSVEEAIKTLKHEKADGKDGFISSHLIYSSARFKACLAGLLSAMYVHGHHPDATLLATICSIPKDYSASLSDDSNYRGIALSSSISKVFDLVYLKRNASYLNTSAHQFAFKKGSGTAMCTLILKEVVKYYMDQQSNVFACFLDASKAFDRVKHDEMFTILQTRGVPPLELRILLDQYERQQVRTTWQLQFSDYFDVGNGIRQGSIASPILFCVYLDSLLQSLQTSGLGCWIGPHYYGALAYADDVTLLCPTIAGLRRMLEICDRYSEQFEMQFNPKKTVCLAFTRKPRASYPQMMLGHMQLEWTRQAKHLGNIVSSTLDERQDVDRKKSDLFGRVNTMLGNLHGVSENVLIKVFNSQCCHLYGVPTWQLSNKCVNEFYTAYNRCVRRVLRLPHMTHTRFLQHFTGMPSCHDMVCQRFLKLFWTMMEGNSDVRYLAMMSARSAQSIIGGNLKYIERKYGVNAKTDKRLHLQQHHLSAGSRSG